MLEGEEVRERQGSCIGGMSLSWLGINEWGERVKGYRKVLMVVHAVACFHLPVQNVWMKVRNAMKAWSPFRVQFKKKSYPWVQLAGHEGELWESFSSVCTTVPKDVTMFWH